MPSSHTDSYQLPLRDMMLRRSCHNHDSRCTEFLDSPKIPFFFHDGFKSCRCWDIFFDVWHSSHVESCIATQLLNHCHLNWIPDCESLEVFRSFWIKDRFQSTFLMEMSVFSIISCIMCHWFAIKLVLKWKDSSFFPSTSMTMASKIGELKHPAAIVYRRTEKPGANENRSARCARGEVTDTRTHAQTHTRTHNCSNGFALCMLTSSVYFGVPYELLYGFNRIHQFTPSSQVTIFHLDESDACVFKMSLHLAL